MSQIRSFLAIDLDDDFKPKVNKIIKEFKKIDAKILQNFYQRGENLTPEAGWKRLKLRIMDIMRQTRLIGGVKIRLLGFVKCCGLGVQIGKKSASFKIPFTAAALALRCTVTAK